MSPRLGFSWTRGDWRPNRGLSFGNFGIGPTGYLRGGIGEFRTMLPATLLSRLSALTGLPTGQRTISCIGAATPMPDWQQYLSSPASIPDQCLTAGVSPALADVAPSVAVVDPHYTAARSWRGNLGYASTFHQIDYNIEGTYSLNLNQPGQTDLNFSGAPRFTTSDEGREVFVAPSSVVAQSGAVATADARRVQQFGHVFDNISTLRSYDRRATLTVTPQLPQLWLLSLSYTLAGSRALASGFDENTFGSPATREWARGDFDVRHQLVVQGGVMVGRFTFTLFGRLQSGLPFTPMVGADVNGDGLVNDRAFIFDPSETADPALAAATRSLLANAQSNVKDCLTAQLGHAAGRNSCTGPWTASLNMQLDTWVKLPRTGNRTHITLAAGEPARRT